MAPAQFRAATGLSPRKFLLHRRIDEARRLLGDPGSRLVDVALSVGLQTQPRFTTIFKRSVGEIRTASGRPMTLRQFSTGPAVRCCMDMPKLCICMTSKSHGFP